MGRLCEVCRDVTATIGAGIKLIVNGITRGSICVSNDVSDLIEELQHTLGEGSPPWPGGAWRSLRTKRRQPSWLWTVMHSVGPLP